MKKLSEIFEIKNSKSLELINCIEDIWGVPFVSRTSENNWTVAKVKVLDDIEPMPWHAISVALWGSVLASFYQSEPFYTSFHIACLYPKMILTVTEMLYYCSIIEANRYRYSYWRQANRTLKDILVPSPEEIPMNVKKYNLEDKFIETPLINKKLTIDIASWKWFQYDDIFDVVTGKWPTKIQDIENSPGDTPFISTIAWNNWLVIKFEWDSEHLAQSITVANDGSVWSTFYQPRGFSASYKVNVVKLKNRPINEYIGMFLITLIEKEKYRYAYGRKFGIERMKQTKIKLPITSNGEPDWQFMEDYIKSLPYSASL